MKVASLVTFALAGLAAAQDVQSKPFHLLVSSKDKKIDSQTLQACHSGAAIESLCTGYGAANFNFNTTKGSVSALKGYGPEGLLAFNLPVSGAPTPFYSEPMSFFSDPSSNVAELLFGLGSGQYVAFDSKTNDMVVVSRYDDTKNPPTTGVTPRALTNWYMCKTDFSGYKYTTLSWVYGINAKPQNPSCVKVDVKRKFV